MANGSGAMAALDEAINNLIGSHCRVSADGTLAWRGRCLGAPTEFIALLHPEYQFSAVERCKQISNDSHVIGPIATLRPLSHEFASDLATVRCWQAIADAVLAEAQAEPEHQALARSASSLLANIKARRGIPPPAEALHLPMHPRDRACRGLDDAAAGVSAAPVVAAEDAPAEEIMTRAMLLQQNENLRTRLAKAREDNRKSKRTAEQLERKLAAEIKLREQAQAELERFTYAVQPKRMWRAQLERGFVSGSRLSSSKLTPLGGYRLAMKRMQGYANTSDVSEMLEVTSTMFVCD